MSHIYDNWERLVRATLRREHLRLIAQRTPSDLSLSSSTSSGASPLRVSSIKLPSLAIGEAFDYDQILRASNYFSNSNLIRHGRSGELFYGVLDDGTPVVVKKIDLSTAVKESYYISEVEAFNSASHSRLVPLIGHCLDNLNDKFLVYKYMTNRDLSSSFFREVDPDDCNSLRSLDWITRLKIATGAAEALCHLHHGCFQPLVHRDVQASSILLDDNYEVRFGSLNDVCAQEKENGSNQNRIAGFPQGSKEGTSGSEKSKANCAYDVYCFGKVLLELVTGKLGFSAAIAKDSTMNDWMEKTLPYINITEKELVAQIIDPSLAMAEDLLMEVWGMAVIAKACLHPQPSKRPLIIHVLLALQNPVKVVTREGCMNKTELVGQILGPSLIIDENLLMEVWAMAAIAKACLDNQPSKHPQMENVLKKSDIPAEDSISPLLANSDERVLPKGITEQSKIDASNLWKAELKILYEDFTNVISSIAVDAFHKGKSSEVPVTRKNIPERPTKSSHTGSPKPELPELKTACEDVTKIVSSTVVGSGTLHKGKLSKGPVSAKDLPEQSKIIDALHKGKSFEVPVTRKDIPEQPKIGSPKPESPELKTACEDVTKVIGSTAFGTLQKGKLSKDPVSAKDLPEQYKIGGPKLRRSQLEAASEDFTNVIGSMAVSTSHKGKLSNGPVPIKDEKEQSRIGAPKLERAQLETTFEGLTNVTDSETVGSLHNAKLFKGPIHTKDVAKQFKIGVKKYGRAELKIACGDFTNVIGSTAAGTLYKGKLSNRVEIAVLSLSMASSKHWSRKLEGQFREKVATLSKVNHENFVNILGYCDEEEPFTRMLVFELVSNGSLFEHLHEGCLDWEKRMRIVMGIAYCLEHMHQLTPPVAHKHLHSSQVYLTEDYAAKISDFGFLDEVATAEMHSIPESDICSFGVLLFEIVTGFPYKERSSSLNWAVDYALGGRPFKETVDLTLRSFDPDQLAGIEKIIRSCLSPIPIRKTLVMGEITARLRKVTGIGPHASVPKMLPPLRKMPTMQQCGDKKSLDSQCNNTSLGMKQSLGHTPAQELRPSSQQQRHIQTTTKREWSFGFPNILTFFLVVYALYIFLYILPPRNIKDSVREYIFRQISKCLKGFWIKLKTELLY